MISLRINDCDIKVEPGTTIFEAARKASIDIPSLCKHDDLPATAACGICVVKIKGWNNMARSCCTPVQEGMNVITHDPEIIRVRRSVLELILSAHPNECLTCGRNGTCELQRLAQTFGIRREAHPPLIRELPRDESTRSIILDPRKCIKCGRCLIVCQQKQNVWALCFLERGLNTRIAPAGEIGLAESPCIRCGQCSAHCPVGAILEYDETDAAWDALRDPENHCVAQVAPAVRVSLGEAFGYPAGMNLSGQLYAALRLMGFKAVFDTNFGADMTVMEEASELALRLREHPERLPLITTCCPSWVDFMEKFHADMIPHFSSCKSPHAIVGTLAKTYYAQQAGIDPAKIRMVSIMPCTAKKFEITRTEAMFASGHQDVDLSLTTRELIRMIRQASLSFKDLNCLESPDSPLGEHSGAGVIFGVTGGVMEAALRTAHHLLTGEEAEHLEFAEIRGLDGIKTMTATVGGHELRVAVAHGTAHVETVLAEVRAAKEAGREPPYHFIEVMACPGGCIGGGGQGWRISNRIREARAEGLFKDDRVREIRCSHNNPAIRKIYDDFIGKPLGEKAQALFHTRYQARPQYKR